MAAVVNNVRTQGRCRRVSTSVYSSLTPRLGPSVRGQDPRHCNVNCTCKDGYCHVAGCSKISLHLQGRFLYIYIYTLISKHSQWITVPCKLFRLKPHLLRTGRRASMAQTALGIGSVLLRVSLFSGPDSMQGMSTLSQNFRHIQGYTYIHMSLYNPRSKRLVCHPVLVACLMEHGHGWQCTHM